MHSKRQSLSEECFFAVQCLTYSPACLLLNRRHALCVKRVERARDSQEGHTRESTQSPTLLLLRNTHTKLVDADGRAVVSVCRSPQRETEQCELRAIFLPVPLGTLPLPLLPRHARSLTSGTAHTGRDAHTGRQGDGGVWSGAVHTLKDQGCSAHLALLAARLPPTLLTACLVWMVLGCLTGAGMRPRKELEPRPCRPLPCCTACLWPSIVACL